MAGIERPVLTQGIVNGANWLAARNGLSSDLVDPATAERLPAFELIERMLDSVGSELDRFGDRDRVENYLARLRREGTPAARQRSAFEAEGVAGLLTLYRASQHESG